MIRSIQALAVLAALTVLGGCNKSTKVISEWDAGAADIENRQRIAVVAMMPEALQRLTMEQEIVRVMRKAGRNALVSSDIPGMSGRISRKTVEPDLRAASVDALVVVFVTSGGKGEELEGPDYYTVQVDSDFYDAGYRWFTPVYTMQESEGFYDKGNYLYTETTYFDIVDDRAKWSMITRSKDLEYSDAANSVAKRIVSKMKSTGTL